MAQGGPTDRDAALAARLAALLGPKPSREEFTAALRLLAKWRAGLVANTVAARDGTTVPGGPFAGLHYTGPASEGGRAPRMLGIYEASLHPVIEQIIARAYPLVVDVGCAEGYYAVGLARRMPGARILARDADPRAQTLCADLARANGVADRVEIGGAMAGPDFDICHDAPAVVICDIEGAEDTLLDPDTAPGLLAADILVEVHDCFAPGLSARIAARFAATHKIQRLTRSIRPDALPGWMENFSDLDRLLALWEWRAGPTPWLWMTRKA